MYILVKSITDRKIPDVLEGKNLARLSRECFLNNQTLTIDFDKIDNVSENFCQELFFPLITEFGADYLKRCLKVENIAPEVDNIIKSAFTKLDEYFNRLQKIQNQNCDLDIFTLNYFWLIKAREHCRENSVFAEFTLGITDNELRMTISRLTMEEIQRISEVGWLCFAPRLNSGFFQDQHNKPKTAIDVLLALSSTF